MNSKAWISGIILIVIVIGGGWYVWQNQPVAIPENPNQITVAATIFPLANLVEQIGGDHVNVILLIPPGVTEHSNALSPQQLQVAANARAIFQIGHNLDNRLTDKVKNVVPQAEVVTVDRGIVLRQFDQAKALTSENNEDDHKDTGDDPHYWLTIPNGIQIAQTIRDELQKVDPTHTDDYDKNYDALAEQLQQEEVQLQQIANTINPKQFIAMHNAWSYFAFHYGFDLVGTYEPIEGHEPSVQDLHILKGLVQQYGLKTFYAEPQKAASSVTRFMQQELGVRVLVLDPVGGIGDKNSYQALMRSNIQTLMTGAQ